jgi:hypothetical protein
MIDVFHCTADTPWLGHAAQVVVHPDARELVGTRVNGTGEGDRQDVLLQCPHCGKLWPKAREDTP